MNRKILPLLISLVLILLLATPVLASTNLQVNGDNISPAIPPEVKDGVTYVQLEAISKFMGADINVKYNRYITMIKNENILEFSVDQTIADLNGETVYAQSAPYINENSQILVPLRFVWESLGGQVQWNPNTSTIILLNEETRNEMTAKEILVKSSHEIQQFNSYTTTGDMTMAVKMKGIDDPALPGEITMDMNLSGYYQKEPLAFYSLQNMEMKGIPDMPEELQSMKIESLYKDNTSYTNMPGTGWIKMELPDMDLETLIQQSNTLDPAGLLKLINDYGIIACFGNDVTTDGKDYWVINVNVDKEKYFSQISKMLPMTSLPEGSDMTTLFKDSGFDIFYRIYVDQDTFLSTLTDLDCLMSMNLPNPDSETSDQNLEMEMRIVGSAVIDDFNVPFELPDVSSAKDLSEMVPAENTEETK